VPPLFQIALAGLVDHVAMRDPDVRGPLTGYKCLAYDNHVFVHQHSCMRLVLRFSALVISFPRDFWSPLLLVAVLLLFGSFFVCERFFLDLFYTYDIAYINIHRLKLLSAQASVLVFIHSTYVLTYGCAC